MNIVEIRINVIPSVNNVVSSIDTITNNNISNNNSNTNDNCNTNRNDNSNIFSSTIITASSISNIRFTFNNSRCNGIASIHLFVTNPGYINNINRVDNRKHSRTNNCKICICKCVNENANKIQLITATTQPLQ